MEMVAAKRVKYPHGPTGKEYGPGEAFEALSERDAKALFISGKATYGKPTNKTDLPRKKEEAVVTTPLSETGRYQRRDMRAEAGQTGEEALRPSPRRGRPPRARTSQDSED